MRSKSVRHESSKRRKYAALLALLTPAIGWNAEPACAAHSDPSSRPHSDQATEVPRTSGKPELSTLKLVPLSPQQNGNYGAAMPLIGPVSRSAGHRAAGPIVADDDAWFPRGGRPPLQTPLSPLRPAAGADAEPPSADVPAEASAAALPAESHASTIALDAPANDAAAIDAEADVLVIDPAAQPEAVSDAESAGEMSFADGDGVSTEGVDDDAEPTLDVTDPEQNEPAGSLSADETTAELEPHLDDVELSPSAPPQRLEIRRLQLKNPGSSGSISARPAGNRSGARMSVGDMPLDAAQVHPDELSAETVPAEPPRAALTEQPIAGDRITAAGELILASGPTAANLPVLPQTAQLKPTLEAALRYYWERPEDAAERTHWGMMHSIMVWDKDTQIIHRRQRYNAVAWMAGNNPCRNQLLFAQDRHGISVRTGVGLQGHQGQLLAIFGLVNVPLDYPVYAGRQKYSVADILEREKLDCKSGNELTFTLIALAHYADSDSAWIAADGQDWDVQRVLKEEMAQPIVGAACGGTHRLMGFAHALRRRRAEDKPIVQQWDRADRYVKEFVNYTWTLQNRDGSMSTAWFERPEDNGNMDRKIQTTGHMLEFLLSTVPDAELQSPKMVRTVGYLANTLHAERGHQWQIGPKGHALRALAMYHQRVFGEAAPWRSTGDSRRTAGAAPGRGVR